MNNSNIDALLLKSQQVKSKARRSSLIRKMHKRYPLFADIFIAEELQKQAVYYAAEPTQRDREILEYKQALKTNPNADLLNYITLDYEESNIKYAYKAMAYRELAKARMTPLQWLKASSIEFHSYRATPPYRCSYWHSECRKLGYDVDEPLKV